MSRGDSGAARPRAGRCPRVLRLLATTALSATLLLTGCSSDNPDAADTPTPATPATQPAQPADDATENTATGEASTGVPGGPVAGTPFLPASKKPRDVSALRPGDCATRADGAVGEQLAQYAPAAAVKVPCSKPHNIEMVAAGNSTRDDLTGGAPWPGLDALVETAREVCGSQYLALTGTEYVSGNPGIGRWVTVPRTEAEYNNGRGWTCLIHANEGVLTPLSK